MEVDPKLTILIISNQINGNELFRVHVHELSIRFDDKFQEGIDNNYELKGEIDQLNHMWRGQKIEQNHIFPIILDIMTRHGDYMKDFFFDEEELDSSGQFIEKTEKLSKEKEPEKFFESLRRQKILGEISRADFEKSIRSHRVAEEYVERYSIESKFYYYRFFKQRPLRENWYFMETAGSLGLCFRNC